jgi:hypothetical protein
MWDLVECSCRHVQSAATVNSCRHVQSATCISSCHCMQHIYNIKMTKLYQSVCTKLAGEWILIL